MFSTVCFHIFLTPVSLVCEWTQRERKRENGSESKCGGVLLRCFRVEVVAVVLRKHVMSSSVRVETIHNLFTSTARYYGAETYYFVHFTNRHLLRSGCFRSLGFFPFLLRLKDQLVCGSIMWHIFLSSNERGTSFHLASFLNEFRTRNYYNEMHACCSQP